MAVPLVLLVLLVLPVLLMLPLDEGATRIAPSRDIAKSSDSIA